MADHTVEAKVNLLAPARIRIPVRVLTVTTGEPNDGILVWRTAPVDNLVLLVHACR